MTKSTDLLLEDDIQRYIELRVMKKIPCRTFSEKDKTNLNERKIMEFLPLYFFDSNSIYF